jgi:hypothetical protein
VDLVVSMGRHHHSRRINGGAILAAALLAFLLAASGWALMQAHADCLAGRLPGPWC